jgi:hypothetical protein
VCEDCSKKFPAIYLSLGILYMIMKRGLRRPKKVLTGKRGRPRKLFNMVEVNEEEVEPEEEENHENEELHDVAGLIELGDPQTVSEALSSPTGKRQ